MARRVRARKTRSGRTVVSFNLRMPEDLRRDLEEAAAVNDRSMNAEIVSRLYDHIASGKSLARMKTDDPLSMMSYKTTKTIVETVLMEWKPPTPQELEVNQMGRAKQYRSLAARCLEIARNTNDTQTKAAMLQMAEKWSRLAEETEREKGTAAISATASSTQSSAPSADARSAKEPTP